MSKKEKHTFYIKVGNIDVNDGKSYLQRIASLFKKNIPSQKSPQKSELINNELSQYEMKEIYIL